MPCSSHMIILIPDCCSFFDRGGGCSRAKDLLSSHDLDWTSWTAGWSRSCAPETPFTRMQHATRSCARCHQHSVMSSLDHDGCVEHDQLSGFGRDGDADGPDASLRNVDVVGLPAPVRHAYGCTLHGF